MSDFTVSPCGDAAITVCFGETIDEETAARVRSLRERLEGARIRGITGFIPAYCSLTVCYDPLILSYKAAARAAERAGAGLSGDAARTRTVHRIPVCYGGRFGEDLGGVARLCGLTPDEVVRIHSGRDYLIYMIGFLPGFPYLGGMDGRIACARLETPRTAIPAGSVGIGGDQTGIYPMESPGGWRLIGRTPVPLYDPDRDPPVLYRAGEYIRFCPVTLQEYMRIENDAKAGKYAHRASEESV